MFCEKCGQQYSNDVKFCGKCGEKLVVEEICDNESDNSIKLSIAEYFEKECSEAAAKRQKYLKIALLVSGIIQLLLMVGGIRALPMFFLLPTLLIFEITGWALAVSSFLLAKKGIKNKTHGSMFASIILAFFSVCICGVFSISVQILIRILLIVIPALHVVMFVLNIKDAKEYKEYLSK